ncbi:hypothetical protein K7432_013831 [Basidiobolus ranarum]|uniref:Uncharacterized protein n=1 Tax=Basidiobolus ranarum TaxID=34480 RepID=A0ABR2WIM2_9FUNG
MVVAKLVQKSAAIDLQHSVITKVSHDHHVEKISFSTDNCDIHNPKSFKEPSQYLTSPSRKLKTNVSQRSQVKFLGYDLESNASIPDIDDASLEPSSQRTQSTSRAVTIYTIDRDFDQTCFADKKATKAGGYWDKTRGTVKVHTLKCIYLEFLLNCLQRTLGFIFHKKKWRIDGQYLVTLGQHKIRASTTQG